ncbi:hypothetical protein HYFRA_00007916 [Hymenoscyphus fraxineus]|uniref:Uncharacterized protein n=1 Tax=Hymenoscyphus fraxineus TaxID=746836 RepID=A0A9N9PPL6_9HELO|nr:hypothetical protein HYFRA_00007916 [Hymenoscyphus fraxineus]
MNRKLPSRISVKEAQENVDLAMRPRSKDIYKQKVEELAPAVWAQVHGGSKASLSGTELFRSTQIREKGIQGRRRHSPRIETKTNPYVMNIDSRRDFDSTFFAKKKV